MAREGDDTLQVEGTKRHPGTRWSESRTFRSRGVLRGSSGVSFAGVLRGVVVLHFKLKGFDEAMQKRQGRYLLD